MNTILSVKKLEKSYKEKKVIKGIDFDVNKGEILCILGPNGAGKSTTINILTGALRYEQGEVLSHNAPIEKSLKDYKNRLGIVPQDIALYEELSAQQNICFFASLYGLKGSDLKLKCQKALEFVGLEDRKKDKVNTFSSGMKRRLNIACAIAHEPELLIMDEPTVGIDPQSRSHILGSIKKLRDNGMTVIYTTHYMEEVEEISTRILVMDHGQIIAGGTKESLKEEMHAENIYHIEVPSVSGLEERDFYSITGVTAVQMKENHIQINTLKNVENLDQIINICLTSNTKIHGISCETPSLETVFLKLTGRSLRD